MVYGVHASSNTQLFGVNIQQQPVRAGATVDQALGVGCVQPVPQVGEVHGVSDMDHAARIARRAGARVNGACACRVGAPDDSEAPRC